MLSLIFGSTMKKWQDLTYDEKTEALGIAYTYFHENGYFGSLAQLPHIYNLINDYRFTSLLDYGCGSGTKKIWRDSARIVPTLHTYYPYDPYSTEDDIRTAPKPGRRFDLVSCTDVLEHVLPEDIDDLLQDLLIHCQKMLYVTICLTPAGKQICDANGKTAYDQSLHTLVKPKAWWLKRIANAERAVKKKQNRTVSIKIVWT